MTGISPFYSKNQGEVILKNKEAKISLTEDCWKSVSEEGKDLVLKMIAKNPQERCTAGEALTHKWFSSEHNDDLLLSCAAENMKKYNTKDRFNLKKIKPEFSMLTCTPLLNSRYTPINTTQTSNSITTPQILHQPKLIEEDKCTKEYKGAVQIRGIFGKYRRPLPKMCEDSGENYDEYNMNEVNSALIKVTNVTNKPFIPQQLNERHLPTTPGFCEKNSMSHLNLIATPMQNRMPLKLRQSGKKIAGKNDIKEIPIPEHEEPLENFVTAKSELSISSSPMSKNSDGEGKNEETPHFGLIEPTSNTTQKVYLPENLGGHFPIPANLIKLSKIRNGLKNE